MSERIYIRMHGIAFLLLMLMSTAGYHRAQAQGGPWPPYFKVKNNTMYLALSRKMTLSSLDSFAKKFNVTDIGLYQLITTGKDDSLKKNGWNTKTDPDLYIVTKPITSSESYSNAEGKIIFSAVPTPDNWREVGGNKVIYGVNRFNAYESVSQEEGIIYFYLDGYSKAKGVRLAGSFTNWQHGAFPMAKTPSGWMVKVQLPPGPYYYKFIVDDNGWMVDPANALRENDGRGNINSVMFVTNKQFFLKGYDSASVVYLSGSFNNWNETTIPMKKTTGGWEVDMYLDEGTYQYEFIVDGKTVRNNNNNTDTRPFTSIGKPHNFILKGYTKASKVAVAGNFNDWKPDQLFMKRTNDGWILPYVLGAGNYQYKFIVDGKWMTDPDNDQVIDDGRGNENSFMIIDANYTFRLKGYENAKHVFLAGDFNNFSGRGVPMIKTKDGWECRVFLGKGKHRYRFLVDGKWIRDSNNKLWEDTERGPGNSVLWVD